MSDLHNSPRPPTTCSHATNSHSPISMINLKEVAQHLHCSYTIAYRLCNSGELPAVKTGKKIMVPIESLNNYIREQTAVQTQKRKDATALINTETPIIADLSPSAMANQQTLERNKQLSMMNSLEQMEQE